MRRFRPSTTASSHNSSAPRAKCRPEQLLFGAQVRLHGLYKRSRWGRNLQVMLERRASSGERAAPPYRFSKRSNATSKYVSMRTPQKRTAFRSRRLHSHYRGRCVTFQVGVRIGAVRRRVGAFGGRDTLVMRLKSVMCSKSPFANDDRTDLLVRTCCLLPTNSV